MLFSAVQYFRSKSSAVVWFILVFLGTLIWALFDAGWDFWPLVSRLMVPTGFMLFGFATWPALRQRHVKAQSSFSKPSYALAVVLAAGMLGAFVQMFQPPTASPSKGKSCR